MQKTPYVIPIVGGRKVEHLMDNIAALDIALSPEQVKYLEDVLPFKPGLPHEMIVGIKLIVVDSAVCANSVCRAMERSTRRCSNFSAVCTMIGGRTKRRYDLLRSRCLRTIVNQIRSRHTV